MRMHGIAAESIEGKKILATLERFCIENQTENEALDAPKATVQQPTNIIDVPAISPEIHEENLIFFDLALDTSTSGDSTQVLIPTSGIEEKSPEKAESLAVDDIIKLFDDI